MSETNFRYPGQPQDEVTERVIYKHIFSIVPFLFAIIVVALIVVTGFTYLMAHPNLLPNIIAASALSLAMFVVLAILLLLLGGVIWIWRSNKIVITDQHIVDIDQVGLFNRKVSTLALSRIQDVSAKVHGPLQTILGYGIIDVQTAGEDRNFRFDYVPNPYELENYILKMHRLFYASDDGVSEEMVDQGIEIAKAAKKVVKQEKKSQSSSADMPATSQPSLESSQSQQIQRSSGSGEASSPELAPAHPNSSALRADKSVELTPPSHVPIDPASASTPQPIPFDDQGKDKD